jgi:hypothetical protein
MTEERSVVVHSAQQSVEMRAPERGERDVGAEERMRASQPPEGHTLCVLLCEVESRELSTAFPTADALVATWSEGQLGRG